MCRNFLDIKFAGIFFCSFCEKCNVFRFLINRWKTFTFFQSCRLKIPWFGNCGIIPGYMQECSGYEVPGRDLVWAWADRPLDGDDPGRGHRPLGGQGRAGRDVSNQFKGKVPRDFRFQFFSWISFPRTPEYIISAVSIFFENSLRYHIRSSSIRKVFIILFGHLCNFQRLGGRWFMKKTWSKKILWHCHFKRRHISPWIFAI